MEKIEILKKLINSLRDIRKGTIRSDDMTKEQLFYLQEGFREGLCTSAMIIADELDACLQEMPDSPESCQEGLFMELEEQWWHTHNDDEGDIGSPDRL